VLATQLAHVCIWSNEFRDTNNFFTDKQMYKKYTQKKGGWNSHVRKLLRMTKLTSFFLLVGMLQVNAAAIAQKISLSEKNASLAKVFKKISRQTGYGFMIEGAILKAAKPVTLTVENAELEAVLTTIFKDQPLKFTIGEQAVIVSKKTNLTPLNTIRNNGKSPNMLLQQLGRISGKIVDDRGEPLVGASVKIMQTNNQRQSSVDGSYNFSIAPGSYTIEVSYISFQTKRITEVLVKEGELTQLTIALSAAINEVSGVVVTGSFKKESVAGLYARQKNAATVTDGISAEQIAATPDRNIGESLKRITGLSTTDDKNVVVRGAAERYNMAQLDGILLPSTTVMSRNFDFSIVPTNLVESVVVSKSATPDMNAGFAGGLVQVNTISIPQSNFLSFSLGSSYNSRSTGKDFYGYQRGKYDYLGFDDGSRDHFPEGLNDMSNFRPGNAPNSTSVAKVIEQNRRIGGTERLGSRVFKSAPSQNYQFSIGRIYDLSQQRGNKFGFVGSVSYRNTQSIDDITNIRRGNWSVVENPEDPNDLNTGGIYSFNTTLGTMLNAGYRDGKHQITSSNFYSRVFSEQMERITGWAFSEPKDESTYRHPVIREDDRPVFTNLLQNKLSGEHVLGRVKLDWNVARVTSHSEELDAVTALLMPEELANEVRYNYIPGQATTSGGGGVAQRDKYVYSERNLTAGLNATFDFNIYNQKQSLKVGLYHLDRHASYEWTILPIVSFATLADPYKDRPLQEWGNDMGMENPSKDPFYMPSSYHQDKYEGKDVNRAGYLMMDNKIAGKLRMVWGARYEYLRYDSLQNSMNMQWTPEVTLRDSVRWRLLPSAHLTYTPIDDFNIRVSYAKTVVRPSLMDNSRFSRYNAYLGRMQVNLGLESTAIDNLDVKLEWFPNPGDILSIGAFYKYFDKPAEFYGTNSISGTDRLYVFTNNSDWGKIRGMEMEFRKSLGFIAPGVGVLRNTTLSGNITLLKSEVRSRELRYEQDEAGNQISYYIYLKNKRPLYGQVPLTLNGGLNYTGKHLGFNVTFNHMGYKTFITGVSPNLVEYERPRSQLDAQVTYRFFHDKAQFKLNMSNLTDAPYRFFVNSGKTYELKTDEFKVDQEWHDMYKYKFGFTDKFEEGYSTKENGYPEQIGDDQSFTRYIGRSFSLSLSYNF